MKKEGCLLIRWCSNPYIVSLTLFLFTVCGGMRRGLSCDDNVNNELVINKENIPLAYLIKCKITI